MADFPSSNRGSDIDFKLIYKAAGSVIDLSAYTVEVFEPHPKLVGFITVDITDAPNGEVTGRIEWDDGFLNGKVMSFRVRISNGGNDISSPAMWVTIK